MKKKRVIILLLVIISLFSFARSDVFFSASSDVYTRYIFRGVSPAGNQPALSINFSAFFESVNLNLSQWYVNSLSDITAYHELGTMLSYYHYFNNRLIASGGMTMYLFPNLPDSPLAGVEMSLTLADMEFVIPYFIETYFDFVLKSWYAKFSAGYTFDLFLPINLSASCGVNLLAYDRFGMSIPAGFSDAGIHISSYMTLKRWQISPKLSLWFTHNAIYSKPMLQASVNLSYSF